MVKHIFLTNYYNMVKCNLGTKTHQIFMMYVRYSVVMSLKLVITFKIFQVW